jgi:TRAP-type C4-dicarboxylate transport system permease small subunit
MTGMIQFLTRLQLMLQKLLMAVAAVFLVAMMLMTCTDIVMRKLPQCKPLPGVFELMGLFGSLVVACALGYTQGKKDHLAVDILTNRFPPRIQKMLDVVNRLICMAFSVLACWQVCKVANTLCRTGEVTETLRMVYYPFTYGVAAGFALLAFVFLVELLKVLAPGLEPQP